MFVRFYVQLWYLLLLVVKLGHTSYVSHPNINFDTLDKLIIAGSYDGISIYKDTDQLTQISQNTSSIISLSNDTLKLLGSSEINGAIYDSCLISTTVYFGGNFTTINGLTANHIAAYNLNTNELNLLSNGLDGPVYSLYCDTQNKQVYVGGSFVAPITTSTANYTSSFSQFGGSVALWKNNAWAGLPWKGFNGPVYSIIEESLSRSLLFGGQFDTTTDGQSYHAPASQPIALSATGVTATSTATGSADPSTIICAGESNTSPWYPADNTNSTWQLTFPEYSVNPSLIRLVNSKLNGHQTKEFSIRSLTSSAVYQFTYLDPATNTTKTCSTNCTLSNDPNITFQDFRITDLSLTSGIAIDIHSWYGTSGGLASVQVFQSEIFTYAVNANTANACTTSSNGLPKVTTSGTWTNSSTYLSSTVKSSENPSVTFYPNLVESGIYEVLLYSPACDTACTDRTDVDLSFQSGPSSTATVIASQTATDGLSVYTGYFEVSDSFTPSVKLSLASNVTVSSSETVTIYAFAVQFVKSASSDSLQSIAQYNYTQTNITASNIPWGPLNENVPYKSTVYSMALLDKDVYIGGNFSSTDSSKSKYSNIVKYDSSTSKLQALQGTGVNGAVNTVVVANNEIYVGGSFTGISDTNTTVSYLNNVARYNVQSASWNSLLGGVDSTVTALNWLADQQIIIVSGQYTQLLQTSSTSTSQKAPGNAYWNVSSQTFQSPTNLPYISGTVNSAFTYNSDLFFAGSIISAQRYHANGLSYVSSADALSLFSGFDPSTQSSAYVNAGSLNNSNSNEISVFGGQFSLSDGIQNLAIYNNNTWNGFSGANWQGSISTMAIHDDTLLVGGNFTGSSFSGLAIFSISNKSLSSAPEVKTTSETARVNIIRSVPQQDLMIVGGSFSAIGSITCTAICSLNTQTNQWSALSTGINGEVNDVQYVNGKLVVSGNLTLNNSPLLIAEYDFSSSNWGPLGTADLPGPSHMLSYDNITQSVYISGTANSSSYLRKWNGEQFVSLSKDLGPGSVISNLAMLPVTGNTTYQQNVLLASGFINLGTCNVSAAFYDDTDGWIPYLVASTNDGSAGSSLLSSLFSMNQPYFATQKPRSYLPTPLVILVSIAASLGIVFLIVLGAMAIVVVRKRRDRKISPQSNPATYYGKPPRAPDTLLAMLKENSPEGEKDSGLEKSGHEQFYSMAASISTDRLQEQNLTPYTSVVPNTARSLPQPPNNTYQPTNTYQSMFNTPSPTTITSAASTFAPITTRPESYARPYSEIQRDSNTSSFYNNEYTNTREMADVPRSYSPFNPFRNSEIGLAVSDAGSKNNVIEAAAAAGVAGALVSNTSNTNAQGTKQQVSYNNIPPPNTSHITVDTKTKPEGVRWTTAPPANMGTVVVEPLSMVGHSDSSSFIDPMGDTKKENEVRWMNTPVPNVSTAVVKPVSMIDPGMDVFLNAPPRKDQTSEMQRTTAPSSQNTVVIPSIVTHDDSHEEQPIEKTSLNHLAPSTATLDTLPPSSNVRWTNYNTEDAVGKFKVDPVTRDSAFNSFYGLPGSTDRLSMSQGFLSDPELAKFTLPTEEKSNKSQYHASLSSFAWPDEDEDGKTHALETAGVAAFASNTTQKDMPKKEDDRANKFNSKMFRLSDAGSLAPIDTRGFGIDQEDDLHPDSAVRWKTAKVGSPIETAFAPTVLQPATATVTTRTNSEKNPFDSYYNVHNESNNNNNNNNNNSSSSSTFLEPIGRKSETIDEVIASRDLNALSFLIDEEEPLPSLQKKAVNESAEEKTTPLPNRTATPSSINTLAGRAASKRMVEKYFSSRKSIAGDKRSKYKSDFKTIMQSALENNTKADVGTEDQPLLYYAKFDFDSREHGELGFEKNDAIIVVDNTDDIWWMGYKADKSDGSFIRGVFPSNYVEVATSLR